MKDITLTLTLDEVKAIIGVLNDLPTKTGAYPLVVKMMGQVDSQLAPEQKE